MLIPTLVMAVAAIILLVIGYCRGSGEHIIGLKNAANIFLGVIPMLIFAFIVAGMVHTIVPHHIMAKWVGAESGIKGILIGTVVGACLPGGPYVNLPIVAILIKSGASIGTTVAFITGWSLWALTRLPLEIGLLGWRFALVRFCCTFFFAPIAGIIAQFFFGKMKII